MPLSSIWFLCLLDTLGTFFAISGILFHMGSSTFLETMSYDTVSLVIELPITLVFMLQQIFIQIFNKFLYLMFLTQNNSKQIKLF